jgi:hypothetical protein
VAAVLHPARSGHREFIPTDPSGDAGGIAWVELAADPERLHAWLGGGEELPLRYAAGEPPGLRAVGLGSGDVIR